MIFFFPQQHGEVPVNIHHLEYEDGGILDIDDLLGDLVEDREKVRSRTVLTADG